MDTLERLNTLCPVCDGPINFEAIRLGEWVNCPHCQETIALGSVEPLPSPRTVVSTTAGLAHRAGTGFRLLACAGALFLLLAGGVLWYSRVAAFQPQPKSHEAALAANAPAAPPVQPPVALPTTSPAPLPPLPNLEEARAEQLRQQQEQLNRQQLLAELRRANDLAEANARWQRLHEMESGPMLDLQPVEILQPTEIIQPIQPVQVIQTFPPPIRIYGGGLRIGSPIIYNSHSLAGQRVPQS
jgi:hypothetical protein